MNNTDVVVKYAPIFFYFWKKKIIDSILDRCRLLYFTNYLAIHEVQKVPLK